MRAVVATRNPHKLEELRALLPDWVLEAAAGEGPEETGATYEENARLKAHFDREPGLWAIGEDSGIEVAALGGEPGLHSARWADGDQAEALLERLEGEGDRRARMVSVLVAVSPAGDELTASGVLDGTIATGKRGSTGFGYDPIFVPLGLLLTVAELGEDWKNEHSHRAIAAQRLAFSVGAARG